MRAPEFSGDLSHGSRLSVGEQIEGSDLREREFARCQLLRRREDKLAPETANGDDAPADLTEALPATRHLIEGALRHLAAGDAHGGGEATAQPFGGLRHLGDAAAARCMHMRIQYRRGREGAATIPRMSPNTSWIFPGQGSQSVGMGAAALAASPAARAVLAEAEAALGEPLGQLMATGPAEALERTEVAQPAILTISIALLAAARERAAAAGTPLDEPILIAGHSAGQYAAAVAAGALSVADGVRLARRRGELMQASGGGRPGAMAAILGLPEGAEADVIAAGAKLGILVFANRNSPGQIVLSGEVAAIEAAVAAASAAGAKRAVRLQVSIASHSPLMEEAAAGMREALAAVAIADPKTPMLANATAARITTAAQLRDELSNHLTGGVDWIAAVNAMAAAGTKRYIEVGSGRVLAGLVKRIPSADGAEILSIEEVSPAA